MATVMIVEDDNSLRLLMSIKLGKYYDIVQVANGAEALKRIQEKNVDLIVADIMMPLMNGYDLVRELRNMNNAIPIILATAKQSFNDKRDGFAVGADDYMIKPINFDELNWRIDALLRRSKIVADKEICIGDFQLNLSTFEALYRDKTIDMARKEFELLYKLLSYPNKLFSKDRLMEDIWGYDSPSDDTTIRTHINRLRNKLEGINEFEIITIRGIGYKAVIKSKTE